MKIPYRQTFKKPIQQAASAVLETCGNILKSGIDILTETVQYMELYRVGHLTFTPREDDIFIVTYPRSGTTWMQMILYQLASGGNMDFTHICQVAPWFERVISFHVMTGQDIEAMPSPRIFKTHLTYQWIPKGQCKYIYVVRNGKDVAVSYYHFYRSHLGFKGDFSEFFDHFIQGQVQFGSWFDHVSGWWEHRDRLNILFLDYETLVRDLESCLDQIIQFCGFQVNPNQLSDIMEKCSFSFMKQHENKFDHLTAMIWEKGYKQNTFIRKGETGEGKTYFTQQHEKVFKQQLKRMISDNYFNNPTTT